MTIAYVNDDDFHPSNDDHERWTHNGWEMVVGLEVHVELATQTKLFSASPNRFGDEPNTNIDPVTLGLPGALPVLNRQAVELAMRLGLALNCRVQKSTFARKNYFYPDMPKAYQISQYEEPITADGWLDLPDGYRVGIERGHLEEDTGKSTHVGGAGGRIHGSDYSLIDFNRAGVPLVEIVSRPDIRHPDQAKAYATELRAILVAIGASDAKMEEGSMRVDANVSVRRPGDDFNTALRDQERQLGAVARSCDRVRGKASDRTARSRRTGRPADASLGRERRQDPHAAFQGGRRRLPVLPRTRSGRRRSRPRVDRAGPRRAAAVARRASDDAGRGERSGGELRSGDAGRRARPGRRTCWTSAARAAMSRSR